MATVEKQTRPVEVTTIEEREVVILTLSSEEAQTLTDVYARIGGNPARSNREHTGSVYQALSEAGFHWRSASECGLTGDQSFMFGDVR